MKLSYYGGVQEIGGNKILLEEADTRVFLDFGMSFDKYGIFFEEYLKPRSACGMADFVTMRLVPKIDGIYREDLLTLQDWEVHDEPQVDGVLLSHMHLDHAAHISFLDPRIPIYCTDISQRIAKVLLEAGTRKIDREIHDFKRRPLINYSVDPIERDFQLVKSKNRFKVGSFEVEPFNVCHSIPGALAYIIYCPNGIVAYTGDLRLQGPNADATAQFVSKAAEEQPDILLCEGTRIDSTESRTEANIIQDAQSFLEGTQQLVVADFADRDISRFKTFYQIATENDRKLVISKGDAYLIRELLECDPELPDISDDNILIFIEKRRTGRYDDSDYLKWEKEFLNLPNVVKADFVHKNQHKLMIHLGFFHINWLLDIKPADGSIYIHSTSEPHNEEMVIDENRLDNWLSHLGIPRYHTHASGHASGQDIAQMISEMQPRKLVPIHTEKQELFQSMHNNIEYPTLAPW